MFVPGPDDQCPIDIKYLDVSRHTVTDLNVHGEKEIDDIWVPLGNQIDGIDPDRELSDYWTGTTSFLVLMPHPGANHVWIDGRRTRLQANSTRPNHIWPETWNSMSKPQRRLEIQRGLKLEELKDRARATRSIDKYVNEQDKDDYEAQLQQARKDYAPATPSPAMPVVQSSSPSEHREKSPRCKKTPSAS